MKIDSSLLLSHHQQQRDVSKQLGKEDFLKILVKQLQTQNPLEPMKDKQFISQMATFTSLEQTYNMTETLNQFVNMQKSVSLGRQASMIGKSITWTEPVKLDDGTESTKSFSGVVSAVSQKEGGFQYITETGKKVNVDEVIKIASNKDGMENSEQ